MKVSLKVLFKSINTLTLLVVLFVASIETIRGAGVTESSVHFSGLPKLDDIWFKAYPDTTPDVIVDEFLAGVTDWISIPSLRIDLLEKVIAAGHKVLICNQSLEIDHIVINCRDYKGTSGSSNFPLNDSDFRRALSYIYGLDIKARDIIGAQGRVLAMDNILPPSCPYYSGSFMPNTDYEQAWSILQAAGYYVNLSDNWLHWTDGVTDIKIRNMEISYPTSVLYWEKGPGAGFVRAFNGFINWVGAVGPIMTLVPKDFATLVTELYYRRSFDMICFSENIGQYVDCRYWLYERLHSSNNIPGGGNFAGIENQTLDYWLEELVAAPPGSPQAFEAAKIVQNLSIIQHMPYFPISNPLFSICAVAKDSRGELMNIISIPSICCFNRWSWMTVHWWGEPGVAWPSGSITVALEDKPTTLNPWNENTIYGWRILNTVIHPLLIEDPQFPHTNWIPWFATDIQITTWISIPELGITNGTMVTFYLRQDLLWHDLKRVTAYDCINNLKLMRMYRPPRYAHVWQYLVYEEVDGPYKFTAYSTAKNSTWPYYVAEVALLTPKHIADAIEAQGGNILEWNFTRPYKELMGQDPPPQYPFLTQLVGCGPYIFDCVGHVVKFNEFFVNAPVIGGVVGEWSINPDTAYTYQVIVENLAAKENSYEGELTNATVNVKIYLDDELQTQLTGIFLTPFNCTYLGPYTTDPFYSGTYGEHCIRVEVYDNETGTLWHKYTHKFYVVPLADVTTRAGDLIDCFVDVTDILKAADAYGSYPGHPRWNPVCDIAEAYYFIDVMDLLAIVIYYGWSAPWG